MTKERNRFLSDQMEAAEEDAVDRMELLSDLTGGEIVKEVSGESLAQIMDAIGQKIINGDAYACQHINWSQPSVLYIQLHQPDALRCERCQFIQVMRMQGTEEDQTCDFCRQVKTVLYPLMIRRGLFIITGGACAVCKQKIEEDDRLPT